jgi:ElaB/YqjD/DUF883 family membrane-anchored ribosome-binding protein
MSSGADANVEALQAEMAQLRTDFARVTETLKQIAYNRGAEVVGDAKDTADRLTAEVQRQARNVADTIEERPFAAAITTCGIGLVLGMMFSSRR